MKIITIEEHYADSRIIESNAKYGYPSGMAELSGKVRAAYDGMRFTGDKLTDVDTVRFDFMKEAVTALVSRPIAFGGRIVRFWQTFFVKKQ